MLFEQSRYFVCKLNFGYVGQKDLINMWYVFVYLGTDWGYCASNRNFQVYKFRLFRVRLLCWLFRRLSLFLCWNGDWGSRFCLLIVLGLRVVCVVGLWMSGVSILLSVWNLNFGRGIIFGGMCASFSCGGKGGCWARGGDWDQLTCCWRIWMCLL